MAGVSLTGIASGLDTETIIAQLVAIEARPKVLLQTQQKHLTGRRTALEDVARQLRSLQTAIADLRSVLTWGSVQKLTSSDESIVAARLTGSGAPAGTIEVEVLQLARAEQRTFDWTPTASVTIDGVTVDLSGATTVEEAAQAINGTSGIGVYAGVVNGQLVLTGKTVGESFSVSGLTEDVGKQLLAQKTRYTINGVLQEETTASVVETGGLPGVQLTLKKVGTATLSLSVPGPDLEKVQEKIEAFVTTYNATLDLIRRKLTEEKVASPSTSADFAKGALRGDMRLQTLLTNLRATVLAADTTPGVIDTLAEIGITVARSTSDGTISEDGLAGKLQVDKEKLASVLAAHPDEVRTMLGGSGVGGLAQALEAVLDPITDASEGYLAKAREAVDSRHRDLQSRIDAFDRRLAASEQRMRAQFLAMEQALLSSQSMLAWLNGQIAALPTWA
jgi:flagellar hook-associated protein 2